MFGSFRKQVTQQTIQMVRQPFAIFQNAYGVPLGFWNDEFVLGFFGVMIGLVSKVAGQGRLNQTDNGLLLQDTFAALSNMNGVAITRRFSELALQSPQSQTFRLAGDNAEIVTVIMFGRTSPRVQDAIEQVRREITSQGSHPDSGTISSILMMKLFVQPLVQRFDL